MNQAEFKKTAFGEYEIIDTRNNMVLKRNIKTIKKAAAYAEYYSQEITKAIKAWGQ